MGVNTELLAPPLIEGVIPAFYLDDDGTVKITVPFSANRAVSQDEYQGFSLKVKDIQGSSFLFTTGHSAYDDINNTVDFVIKNTDLSKLNIGQFYKLQIAYVSYPEGIVGHYSTIGISKYTTKPMVEILKLSSSKINSHNVLYTGHYSQEGKDITEKEYSYRFILYDAQDAIYYDSGYIIHNTSNNEKAYEALDVFYYNQDLPRNEVFKIVYSVKTNNGLEISSPVYRISQKSSVYPDITVKVLPILNFEDGYIEIGFEADENQGVASGGFILSRAEAGTNFAIWDEIERFYLLSELPSRHKWKDFTIEQGKTYIYSLQQFSDGGIYSERLISDPIYADFENAFLFDGQKQLKIKYNPKISSFKRTLMESKLDTIGSKFPFIFRNGNTDYHEFPISGLITCLADENNLFLDNGAIGLDGSFEETRKSTINNKYKATDDAYFYTLPSDLLAIKGFEDALRNSYKTHDTHLKTIQNLKTKTSNLTADMYYAEREFKLEVLKWLTNGKPKLFRSPTEGSYIVRLLNVSLTPNDQLGRMLHTFQSTAYEIADCTYENLSKYGIISIRNEKMTQLKYSSLPLSTSLRRYKSNDLYSETGNILYLTGMVFNKSDQIQSLKITDMTPGDIIYINSNKIVIGATGTYEINIPIDTLEIPANAKYNGVITYSYYDTIDNSFNRLADVEYNEVIGRQFIGQHADIIAETKDLKRSIGILYNIHFEKRKVGQAYYNAVYEPIKHEDIGNYDLNTLYVTPPNPRIEEQFFKVGDLALMRDCFYDPLLYEQEQYAWEAFLARWAVYNTENTYYLKKDGFYRDMVYTSPIKVISKNKAPTGNEMEYYGLTQSDPMQVYAYKEAKGIVLNWKPIKLYHPIIFINTSDPAYAQVNLNGRVTSNKYLCDIRDFNNYVAQGNIYTHSNSTLFTPVEQKQTFDELTNYYILEDTNFYLDIYNPETNILAPETYDGYVAMFDSIGEKNLLNDFKNTYQKFGYKIIIDNEELDLTEINSYDYNLPFTPNSVRLTPGVYAEMSYQEQIIQYSLESNEQLYELQELREKLINYETILQREYMNTFIEKDPPQDGAYYNQLLDYRRNYKSVYVSYIALLEEELKKRGIIE